MHTVTETLPILMVKQVPPPVRIGTRLLGPLAIVCPVLNTVVTGSPPPRSKPPTLTLTELTTVLRLPDEPAIAVSRARANAASTDGATFLAAAPPARAVTPRLTRSWAAFESRTFAMALFQKNDR